MNRSPTDTSRLRRSVEWALRRALDPTDVLPLLHRLSRLAPEGSDENVYAQRRLAELLAEPHPWRAALCARRVLAVHPNDDGAWSILALCQSQLGHYRSAAAAYRRALEVAPANPVYAHNLGHLLDIALGRPKDALPLLEAAYEGTARRGDVASSFAHALGRVGELSAAKRVVKGALRSPEAKRYAAEHTALLRWLELGAPAEPAVSAVAPRRLPAPTLGRGWSPSGAPGKRRGGRPARNAGPRGTMRSLTSVLARGLERLPLDTGQRARAKEIAQDAWRLGALDGSGEDATTTARVAAAIAYAIAYVDDVPLSQADVAGCFRVSLPALRGTFKALRCQLGLTPSRDLVAADKPH